MIDRQGEARRNEYAAGRGGRPLGRTVITTTDGPATPFGAAGLVHFSAAGMGRYRADAPERSPVNRHRWCRGHDHSGCEWCRRKPVGVPLVAVGGLEAVPPLVDRRGTGLRRGETRVVAPAHARGRSSRCVRRSPEGEAGREGQTEDGRQVDPKHGCAPASPADPTAPLNTPLRKG